MNILVLCTSPGLGGLELYAEREWRYLQATGHVCQFAISPNSRLSKRVDGSCLFVARKSRIFPLVSAIKLARYIDAHQIDVLHMHWGKDLSLASLAKRFSRRQPRLVYSRHMAITRPKKDFFHRFLYSQVDQVLVISQQMRQQARTYFPLREDQITLLYLGVPGAVAPASCETLLPSAIQKTHFRIGMLGRIEHGKGQHVLVAAMKRLNQQGLDVSATIIGQVMDEAYSNKLQADVRASGLEARIAFIGFIDKPMQAMPCFDVVLLLTYCETFGLVLAEAMRMGVAVIGTDAGGVPDIIEHEQSGLLIQSGNDGALAQALERLYTDVDFKHRLAANGKVRADRLFDEDEHFKKLDVILAAQPS